jgi:hypothetical protein
MFLLSAHRARTPLPATERLREGKGRHPLLVFSDFYSGFLHKKAINLRGFSNPGGFIKRTSTGRIKFILTSVSERREDGEWTHMCRFYFYELILSVYS